MVTCRRDFSSPGKRRSIRPAMMAQVRKVRFISADSASQASRSSPSMSSSNSAASDNSPRSMRQRDVAEAPDRERIFVGDEAERPQARALQPPRQQHAERLVREPALERIADAGSTCRRAGRSRPADRAAPGTQRAPLLDVQPFAHLVGQVAPLLRLGQDAAHAVGEIGRERELAALIGRHLGIVGVGARDVDLVLDQRLVFQDFAGEHEGVARRQRLDEILLDLAEHAAAARDRAGVALPVARERTSRTLSMSASTMVPTFMR